MRNYFIIISLKNLILLLFLTILLCCSLFYFIINEKVSTFFSPWNIEKMNQDTSEENTQGIIDHIYPAEKKILYEDRYDYKEKITDFDSHTPKELLEQGHPIPFKILLEHKGYQRPIYSSNWRNLYLRGWLNGPEHIGNTHHQIFVLPIGASSTYDFNGIHNFLLPVHTDFLKNKEFLIYDFQVQQAYQLGTEVLLVGKPRRSGIQMISFVQDALLGPHLNKEDFNFTLSTPHGFYIDDVNSRVIQYDYQMDQIKKNTVPDMKPLPIGHGFIPSRELSECASTGNHLQLSDYIPLAQPLTLVKNDCALYPPADSEHFFYTTEQILASGQRLPHVITYQNSLYERPIYDPIWTEHAKEGWAYLPKKICENLKHLFSIEGDEQNQEKLYMNLGLSPILEHIPKVNATDKGFLLFDFAPRAVYLLDQQIVIIGTPRKNGMSVLTLPSPLIPKRSKIQVQLVTPDHEEFDYLIMHP